MTAKVWLRGATKISTPLRSAVAVMPSALEHLDRRGLGVAHGLAGEVHADLAPAARFRRSDGGRRCRSSSIRFTKSSTSMATSSPRRRRLRTSLPHRRSHHRRRHHRRPPGPAAPARIRPPPVKIQGVMPPAAVGAPVGPRIPAPAACEEMEAQHHEDDDEDDDGRDAPRRGSAGPSGPPCTRPGWPPSSRPRPPRGPRGIARRGRRGTMASSMMRRASASGRGPSRP